MFDWIGRGKRIETKLDELLGHYGPRPVVGSAPKPEVYRGRDPIIMTDERESKILQDIADSNA